jgi:hypothetical protein
MVKRLLGWLLRTRERRAARRARKLWLDLDD